MSCFNTEAVQCIEASSPMTFIQTQLPCLPVEITLLLHHFELTLKSSLVGKAQTMCPYSGCCWLTDRESPSLQYAPILDAAHPTIRIIGLVHFQNTNVLVIYSPTSHPRTSCLYFFSQNNNKKKNIPGFFFNMYQRAEGPNCNFKAASKGFTWSQLRNKSLI